MHTYSIGKLARAARVSVDTIRYYERSGLLPQPTRRPSGFREYSELDLRQLRFIRSGRLLGFSLEDIADLLAMDRTVDGAAVRTDIERKLIAIDAKIRELQCWRRSLAELMRGAADGATGGRSLLEVFDATEHADEFQRERAHATPLERASQ